MAELDAEFPWGVLLVTDAASKEPIPSWGTPEEQVAVAGSALAVRVLHGDEGEVSVRVLDDPAEASGALIFSGELELASGVLKASDALGTEAIEVTVPAGRHSLQVYANANTEASAVDLVVINGRQ